MLYRSGKFSFGMGKNPNWGTFFYRPKKFAFRTNRNLIPEHSELLDGKKRDAVAETVCEFRKGLGRVVQINFKKINK